MEITKGVKDKSKIFEQILAYQQSFETLKERFTTAPILVHFDLEGETVVEVDVSDLVVAGVLSQWRDNKLKLIVFFLKKIIPAEYNYEIYDKELLAIIRAFEEWRLELAGIDLSKLVLVLSNYRSLEYFMTTKQLNR